MGRSRTAAWTWLLPCLMLLGCGSKKSSGGGGDGGAISVTCGTGEHKVEGTCVADVFDQADIPAPDKTAIDVDGTGERFVRGTAMVLLKDAPATREAAQAIATKAGGQVTGGIPFAGIFQVRFADATTAAALDAKVALLAGDPAVDFATRNSVLGQVESAATPMRDRTDVENLISDSRFEDANVPGTFGLVGPTGRWAYEITGVYKAWDAIYAVNPQLAPVIVAVLDDFVTKAPTFTSLGFKGALDVRRYGDFTPDPRRPPTHGNQVASIIGAPDDGTGSTGILAGLKCMLYDLSPQAVTAEWVLPNPMMPPMADPFGFQGQNFAGIDAVLMGIVSGVRAGARVVNMSLGSNMPADEVSQKRLAGLTKMLRRVATKAPYVLFVAAGRNDGGNDAHTWPAAAAIPNADTAESNVISVDALKHDGNTRARWARSDGTGPDLTTPGSATLAAPGEDVIAQLPNGSLTMFLGASSATPVVSGVAGMMFMIYPEMTGAQAKKMLVDTATRIPGTTTSGLRVNAESAVKAALDRLHKDHPDEKAGMCQTDENACPVDTSCVLCLGTMTMSVKAKDMPPADFNLIGQMRVEWKDATSLEFENFSLEGTAPKNAIGGQPGFRFGAFFAARPPTMAEVTRTKVHIVDTGSDVGYFTAGVKDPQFDSSSFSYTATKGDLTLSVLGFSGTGTLLLDNGFGSTATIKFGGMYRTGGLGSKCPQQTP